MLSGKYSYPIIVKEWRRKMMKYCTNCGKKLVKIICPNCKKELTQMELVEGERELFCKTCNKVLLRDKDQKKIDEMAKNHRRKNPDHELTLDINKKEK